MQGGQSWRRHGVRGMVAYILQVLLLQDREQKPGCRIVVVGGHVGGTCGREMGGRMFSHRGGGGGIQVNLKIFAA